MNPIIRVASNTVTHSLAGAIAGQIRQAGQAEIQVIGAQAVNQAIKGVIVAWSFLGEEQVDIALIPAFVQVDVDGASRTALRLTVVGRELARLRR